MGLLDKIRRIKNLFVREKVVVKEVVVEKPVVLKPAKLLYSVIVMKGRYGIVREIYGRDRVVLDKAVVVQSPDGIIRVRFRNKSVSDVINSLKGRGAEIVKIEVHAIYEKRLV